MKRALRVLHSLMTLALAMANLILGLVLGLVTLLGDKIGVHPVALAGSDFWGALAACAFAGAACELARRYVAMGRMADEAEAAAQAAAQGDTEGEP